MHSLEKRLTVRYTFVHSFYWITYAVCWSFMTVTLNSVGLSHTQAGLVLFITLLISGFVQPALSSLVDRSRTLTSRKACLWAMAAAPAVALLMWFTQPYPLVFALLYVLLGIAAITVTPFLDAMCMEYVHRGVEVNFGLARGVGSLAYAAAALLTGDLIERFNPSFTLLMTPPLVLLTMLAVFLFHADETLLPPEPQHSRRGQALSTTAFLKANPRFIVLIVGCASLIGTHNFLGAYMHIVAARVGGGESAMGIILAVGAILEMPAMLLYMHLRDRGVPSGLMFRVCSIFFVLKALLPLFAPSVGWLYLSQVTNFLAAGFFFPLAPYYVTEVVDRQDLVKGQALITGTGNSLGFAFTSLIGGAIFDHLGAVGGLWFSTIVSAIGALCIFYCTANRPKQV